MKAVILAAGRGSRLGNTTADKPKCMVELGGKPLIEWQCHALRKASIDDIGIVRGYCGSEIHLQDMAGIHFIENNRWSETNMVSSLLTAIEWISHEPVVISYADIVYSSNSVTRLLGSSHEVSISYDPDWKALWQARFVDPLEDAETFRLAADGTITDIGRKPQSVAEIQGQYMGLLKLTAVGLRDVVETASSLVSDIQDKTDMTGLLQLMLERDIKIGTSPVVGAWGEIDSESDLQWYQQTLDLEEIWTS